MLTKVRERLATERKHMAAGAGNLFLASENGPVSFQMIDALIEAMEAQQAEIDELKKQIQGA